MSIGVLIGALFSWIAIYCIVNPEKLKDVIDKIKEAQK